ncbi:MAG: putative zinc-binding metallopeptidase [Pyrinomonadaceae bacterium]
MTDEQLLDMRLCDLPIRMAGTALAQRIKHLYVELAERGLRFRPHVWLSAEWFSPDGVPGFAIPFYLAHPRLMRLERRQMLEVEGATERDCLRIMRHEAGHALSNAYRLHYKRRWRELFGSFTKPYPEFYKPKPHSRNHVLHLAAWYAQAHPAEDFAETFAVWLAPGGRWRSRYQNWPALSKLEYIDELMEELSGRAPVVRRRAKVEPLSELKLTLRAHYERKRARYVMRSPAPFDPDLQRIFAPRTGHNTARPTAVSYLRRVRRELVHAVAEGTGMHAYAVDQIMAHVIDRCRALRLRLGLSQEQTRRKVLVMLTVQTMNGVHTGYHRIPL